MPKDGKESQLLEKKVFGKSLWDETRDGAYPVNKAVVNGKVYAQHLLRSDLSKVLKQFTETDLRYAIDLLNKTPRMLTVEKYVESRLKGNSKKVTLKECLIYCIDDLIIDYDIWKHSKEEYPPYHTLEYFINFALRKDIKPTIELKEIPTWIIASLY